MREVPLHGLADPGLEGLGGLPPKFTLDLAGVDGIAAVVARPVLHVRDLAFIALAIGTRTQLVEQGADGLHDLDVGLFVPAAHVVGLPGAAGLQHAADGAAVVAHIEPVANLHAIAIHGQRFAGQCVDDHQRDQLLGEVEGAVVVAAVGGQHRQPVGVVPGPDEVVAGGLAGGVRTVGLVGMGFGEGRGLGRQGAVDLVGGDVQEPESGALITGQGLPVLADGFEQAEGADHVGLDEVFRAVDGAVHMRFGREIQDGPRPVLGQQPGEQLPVADVPLDEQVARIALQRREVLQIACVGELVEVDEGLIAAGQPVEDEVGADETRAAGDQNHGSFEQRRLAAERGIIPSRYKRP